MSYALCIVESPAKCAKIQGFLGPGWKVVASMGHIRALEEDLAAIGLDRDFEARYTFIKEKGKAMSGIKDAAAGAHTIYLAADDDREGEAIAYSVAVLLKLDPKKAKRAVFHEITKDAVVKAVNQPRLLDMNRVEAQQARAVLDMMVGFTISPLLWKHVGPSLSAGRCQTPALRLLVDREREITDFKSELSWRIKGAWLYGSLQIAASLFDELGDEESALNYLENIHDDTSGVVLSTKTQPRSEGPPKPLITSTLQQEASALFSFQPKQTMKAAQRLYEQGYITYMRTDSTALSAEAILEARTWIENAVGGEYLGVIGAPARVTKGDVPKAQEAHEAIRPTHADVTDLPDDEDWSAMERKIYRLVWQRTVQSLMAVAKSEDFIALFTASGDPGEFVWQSVWKRSLFLGWKKIGLGAVNLDDDEEEGADAAASVWTAATKLKKGDLLKWTNLSAMPQETKAAGRYTEATLVRELERKGIGRPSTFASLVGTILEKGYTVKEDRPAKEVEVTSYHVEKPGQWPPVRQKEKKKMGAEKQKLSPTALGVSVHDFCVKEFPHLFAYGFTKGMEDRLDKVAEGSEHWKLVCRDTWGSYKDKLADLKKEPGSKAAREKVFSDSLKAVQTKKGPLLLREGEPVKFYGWPSGVSYQDMTEETALAFIESIGAADTIGEYNGEPIVKKKGPFGLYVQCGSTRIPFQPEDSVGAIVEKLKAKSQSVLHTIGPYEFRTGQYGPYMMKKGVKAFVSIPQGLDPKVLTEEAAARIYKTGVDQQKAGGGRGGRGRGRGK